MRYHKIVSCAVAQLAQHYGIETAANGQQQAVTGRKKPLAPNCSNKRRKKCHGKS
jgi:hypothetical protein